MRRRRNVRRETPQLALSYTENQQRFAPLETYDGVEAFLIDIPETIPQLGYGSHQFFRYYGKFPSILGREIVAKFSEPSTAILDCYAGSGTTLVEAQIAGRKSFGIDINPLGVLACNVKTAYHDIAALREAFSKVTADARNCSRPWRPTTTSESKLVKWFTASAIDDLGRLRAAVEALEEGPERAFLITAFLGIVRRCSNAYDGEVRPHINSAKNPRPPFAAFHDKFQDMLDGLTELDALRPEGITSTAIIGDSRSPSTYSFLGMNPVGLIVAHPPYLNSFNYLQVFSLEFMWAADLEDIWLGWKPNEIRALEHRAWPATDEDVRTRYYEDFQAVAKASLSVLAAGGVLAVVVGDATIYKQLEPVTTLIWQHLKDMGMEPVEIWFRTTHYGIGKYAYSHRADYHGDADKKDAVMFFRKPVL